ncbi:2S seed storage protein-like [Rutidosis leptorrhynchoides]|uniref:2S seed storage protein-like n=1 Tax=Rutidosis leptorrhynchoides TaxID=125765 RepID=UPI003A9A11CE
MAKLLALALIFATLVSIATAHKTTITTTKEDEDQSRSISGEWECLRQTAGDQLNQCPQHLWNIIHNPNVTTPWEQYFQQYVYDMCCKQLHNIDQECLCDAMEQVFQDALRMMQEHKDHVDQIRELRKKAQQLPNQCNLQLSPQCQIASIRTVITTVIEEDSYSGQSSGGSQQVKV